MQKNYPFEVSTLKSSNVPVDTVRRGDVVRIADSDLDWLRDFYNENYDGQVIKPFSNRFAVSVLNDMPEATNRGDYILLLVRCIDGGKFIQVDMYQKSVGNRVIWTEVLDNSKPMKTIDGHFYMESYTICHESSISQYTYNVEGMDEAVTTYISDIVRYVIFFMQENLNNPEYVIQKTEVHTESTSKPGSKKKKKSVSKKTVRRTMYVPKRVVINEAKAIVSTKKTAENDVAKEQNEKRIYTGHIEEWTTRGHKRRVVHKDGTVDYVDVKPSVHKRNPKLMEKGTSTGVDIKLKQRKMTEV